MKRKTWTAKDLAAAPMPMADEVMALAERVKPLLAGAHPALQGAALAELLSLWLAGHPAGLREELLADHIAKVRELIPVNAAILRGEI